MGLELAFLAFWAIQVLVVIVLALFAVADGRWFAIVGMTLGLAAAFLPFFFKTGSAALGPAIATVLVATVALIVAYGVLRKWKALVATVVILAIPLAYVFIQNSFPSSLSTKLSFLSLPGEIALVCGPIICALLGREMLGWLDRGTATQRSAS